MNTISVYGRVASDVTTNTVNGRTVANFRFASQTKRKDGNGQYMTNFVNVAAWGVLGETAAKYLKKGHRACVSGELVIRPYVGSDKQNHISVEIDANSVDFVETRAEAESKAGNATAADPAPAPVPQTSVPIEIQTDEMPF